MEGLVIVPGAPLFLTPGMRLFFMAVPEGDVNELVSSLSIFPSNIFADVSSNSYVTFESNSFER